MSNRNTTSACVIVPKTSMKTAMNMIIIFLNILIDSQKYHLFLKPLYKNPYCSRHGISSSLFLLVDNRIQDKTGMPKHQITTLGIDKNKMKRRCLSFQHNKFKSSVTLYSPSTSFQLKLLNINVTILGWTKNSNMIIVAMILPFIFDLFALFLHE